MGDSDTWIAQIEKYMDEFLFSEAIKDELSPAVIAGIQRCAQSLEPINFPARKTTTPLDSDTFHELWTAVFPPPAQQFQEWEKGLRDAFAGDISFIEITSRKSYIYELSIWNLKTSRRVDFTLYAESTVMLPLPEGAYYVLCRSSVVFSGGQRWESPWSAFALNISPLHAFVHHCFIYHSKASVICSIFIAPSGGWCRSNHRCHQQWVHGSCTESR